MSKETFKLFVRENPILAKYVNNNSMTWQKFYEMYELYGSNSEVWNIYTKNDEDINKTSHLSSTEGAFKELITVFKGLNLEKVQKGIESIQKAISLVQELGTNNSNNGGQYEARPIYKRFED